MPIAKRTVLILGAGASQHLGYPIGEDLLFKIAGLSTDNNGMSFVYELETVGKLPRKFPFHTGTIDNFLYDIQFATEYYSSIDAYLEHNENYVSVGKWLIARELTKYEITPRVINPGWYRVLFRALFGHIPVDKPPTIARNLSIITYNYDRSLEQYLHWTIIKTFGFHSMWTTIDPGAMPRAEAAFKAIPIVHVHGLLGNYPAVRYSPKLDHRELLAISRKINIINEMQDASDGFCNNEYRRAYRLLEEADRIIFAGFGFFSDNIKRLRFFATDAARTKEIHASIWHQSKLVEERMMREAVDCGVQGSDCHFYRHTTCDDLFANHVDLTSS